jgi:hypothetical protein
MTEPLATCGTCKHGHLVDGQLTKRTCFGAPPTPILVGAAPGPGGGVAMRLELVRPVVNASDPGCAVHASRILAAAR